MRQLTASHLPLGFRFAAGRAGIRKHRGNDLALMFSQRPAAAAGVFTKNCVRAAPVELSAQALRESGGKARVIVANAGNANCATPNQAAVAGATAAAAAALAGVPRHQVLVASTGVIGEPFGEDVIPDALPGLWRSLDRGQFEACAKAIMTTDTVPKARCASFEVGGRTARVAGMAKGAGMIMPDMATMLSFLFTDADVSPGHLRKALRLAVERSFNCITVDSDTSTNDTVLLLANGASGVTVGESAESEIAFAEALGGLTQALAIDIARDGEGASKLARIAVQGAESEAAAKRIAMAIANSPLVKTAIAGADPNWGRILAAAGKSGQPFRPDQADVAINGTQVCSGGMRAEFEESSVQRAMEGESVEIEFRLRGDGLGRAAVWTCDLTEGYVRINADYRT